MSKSYGSESCSTSLQSMSGRTDIDIDPDGHSWIDSGWNLSSTSSVSGRKNSPALWVSALTVVGERGWLSALVCCWACLAGGKCCAGRASVYKELVNFSLLKWLKHSFLNFRFDSMPTIMSSLLTMQRRAQSKPSAPSGQQTAAPTSLWCSSNIWMLFPKRSCVSSGPRTATLTAVGGRLSKLPFNTAENFTARSFVSTSFLFSCPCPHLACKWTWQPLCYGILFVRLNV